MCIATSYANDINSKITEAKEYYNKLKIKEKVFNDVQQDLLHRIESLGKFDLYTGWQLAKSLQKLRQARRKVKNEIRTMETLIKEIGGFRIKENKIDVQAGIVENSKYHERQIKNNNDILEEVNKIFDNTYEENRIYLISEKLPKIKHSTIKVKFNSEAQKQHIIKVMVGLYKSYQIYDENQYVELIDRKSGV